jgi:hypothetical protein
MVGALAGGSLYLLFRLGLEGVIGERATLAAMVLAGVFFTSLLALTGPLDIARAATRAALQGVIVAALVSLAGLRFDRVDDLMSSPLVVVSTLILTLIPLPFLLAKETGGWRDYPSLFTAAWGVVMRATVAWVFVAILWAVIYLSHALLSLVGVELIARLLLVPPVPWLITGMGFGLAMAVALELADVVSAYLVLRLLRLLLPVVLAVLVIFLAAVAVKGIGPLMGGISVGAVLLLMAGVAATLVTSAVDQSSAEATQNPLLCRATQALAAILILPAGLAAWGVWLRVAAHGWTPDRLFAATAATVALGYGAAYLLAVLRGRDWMARIRQANIGMALALMALAVLWLTPVLNPERIATNSQMARYRAGAVPLSDLDLAAQSRWGRAGSAARVELETLAKTDPALARRLAGATPPAPTPPADIAALRRQLQADLSVQPPEAIGFRDQILAAAGLEDLQAWVGACAVKLPTGEPGCALLVADFLPDLPGPEALLILAAPDGYETYLGMTLSQGSLQMLQADSETGGLANFGDGQKLIAALRQTMPPLRPLPRNEAVVPFGGAISLKQ